MNHKIIHAESSLLLTTLIQHEQVKDFFDSLKNHHEETYAHSLRVGLLSIDLGHDNELDKRDLCYLGYAGLLHDVEKVQIPLELLSKDSSLSIAETWIVQKHPRWVFKKLQDFEYDAVKEIVVAHHEFKINPYPRTGMERRQTIRSNPDRRKPKAKTAILAQIVAIADMYDAVTSNRSYKEPMPREETETILRKQFTGDLRFVDQILLRYDHRASENSPHSEVGKPLES
jgi:HD-GYP domain-containing protein (c-di-GMP phosphodiesterase class II)